MRKVVFALMVLSLVALAQRYFQDQELERIKTAGKAYAEVFLNQRPDQALCSLHKNRLPA
ncbi:MAG: sulfur oxidation c-type cytochrome SoxX, partial [Thermus sp.]